MADQALADIEKEIEIYLKQEHEDQKKTVNTDFKQIEEKLRKDMAQHRGYYNLKNFSESPA